MMSITNLRKELKAAKLELDADRFAAEQAYEWYRVSAANYVRVYDQLERAKKKNK